jgi:hypothetical protein
MSSLTVVNLEIDHGVNANNFLIESTRRIKTTLKQLLKAKVKHTFQITNFMRALTSLVVLSTIASAQAKTTFNTATVQITASVAHSPVVSMPALAVVQSKPVGKPMRAATAPAANAKVIAAPAGLDFGVVAPHTILEGNFKLVNTSVKPLKVLGAQPSCQCTTIEITGKEIPAQVSGVPGVLEVPVTMKVSATGIKTAQVKVVVEGEPLPITLDLRAEVAYAVRMAIADAAGNAQPFVDAAEDASRLKGVAQIFSSDGKPFRVLSVQGATPVFVNWNPQSDAPLAKYEVQFSLVSEPCEMVPKYLLVETDRADARMIDARVRHACTRISPALEIAEFRCNAGVVAAGGSATFDIEIKKMGGNRIASVNAVDAKFAAELVGQRADGSSLLVTIRLTPGKEVKGVFMTAVHLIAADANGQPYMTQKPETGAPGQPPKVITLPAEVDLLVYGKVE